MIAYDYRPYFDSVNNRLDGISDELAVLQEQNTAILETLSDGTAATSQISADVVALGSLGYQYSAYAIGFLTFFALCVFIRAIVAIGDRIFPDYFKHR